MVTVVLVALAAATLLDSGGALAAAQEVRYPVVRVPLVGVLRPVDTAARVLGLNVPRDALARAFGNAPIGSTDEDPDGLAARARALAARPRPASPPPPAGSTGVPYLVDGPPVPRALPAPEPDHPLRVLVTGDSTAGEPGYALSDVLAATGRTDLDVRDEPYVGTGLVRPGAFDWSLKAAAQAASYHPDVAVVFLGENDGFPLEGASPYGAAWMKLYAARIQAVIDAYQAGGTRLVIWAAPPIDAQTNPAEGGNVNVIFRNIGAAARAAIDRTPATAMIDQYGLFSVDGHYSTAVPDPTSGAVVPNVRLSDGSHLSLAGGTIVARLLLRYLDQQLGRRDRPAEAAQRQSAGQPTDQPAQRAVPAAGPTGPHPRRLDTSLLLGLIAAFLLVGWGRAVVACGFPARIAAARRSGPGRTGSSPAGSTGPGPAVSTGSSPAVSTGSSPAVSTGSAPAGGVATDTDPPAGR
jgi:hypothetical protein